MLFGSSLWRRPLALVEARPRVGDDQLLAVGQALNTRGLPDRGQYIPFALCDAAGERIEEGQPIPGLRAGLFRRVDPSPAEAVRPGSQLPSLQLFNIDHHALDPRSEHWISSAVLALEYCAGVAEGKLPLVLATVINHSDCDSIGSAALCSGVFEPGAEAERRGLSLDSAQIREALAWYDSWPVGSVPSLPRSASVAQRLIRAVICADHSGQEDPLADCLQGLDHDRDVDHSLDTLLRLLGEQTLSVRAQESLAKRQRSRVELRELVQNQGQWFGDVFALKLGREGREVDNALLPPLVPEAAFTLLWFPSYKPGHWIVKLRLGLAAPSDLRINLLPWDESYGGRWNAGGNSRAGGTRLSLEAWLEQFNAWRKGEQLR